MKDDFLPAILANPDDDTPRLVYADWLQDYGDEDDHIRAEFIRAQCEVEREPEGTRRRRELERRIKAILKSHSKTWTAPLKEAGLGSGWTFRRGFVHGIRISARKFTRVAKKVFEVAPTIRAGIFPDASNEVQQLVGCEHLAKLTEVDLGSMCICGHCPIHRELKDLFNSPQVANLTWLRVSDDRITSTGAKQIAESAYLNRLTHLDVSFNPLGALGVRRLSASPNLSGVTSLQLAMTNPGISGITALAKVTAWTNLASLSLAHNELGPEAGHILANSALLANLRILDLSQNAIGDEGGMALVESPYLEKLERLDLRSNSFSDETVKALRKRFKKSVKL